MITLSRIIAASFAFGSPLVTIAAASATLTHPAPAAIYAAAIRYENPAISSSLSTEYATALLHDSRIIQVDPALVFAIVSTESAWNYKATSKRGAQGLGQLLQSTAKDLGVHNRSHAFENLGGSANYVAGLLAEFSASPPKTRIVNAVASYNAGAAMVHHYGGVPPFAEPKNYVVRVFKAMQRLRDRIAGRL